MVHFVYILKGTKPDGTYKYYRGYTNNLERRLKEHSNAKKNKYPARFKGNIELMYYEEIVNEDKKEERRLAMKREQEVKKWTRKKIERLLIN